MITPVVLWVDLTQRERVPNSSIEDNRPCRICRPCGAEDLNEVIRSVQPEILCFEFEYPDAYSLALLTETKRRHPSIPLLMVVEPHSEALAIWALRARVWDYFIKPVTEAEIWHSIMPLFEEENYNRWHDRIPRNFIKPMHDPLDKPPQTGLSHTERAVIKARAYIESHLEEKISEQTMAKSYGLSTSCFSRTFKRVNGLTFSGFVLQARVKRAMRLLEDKNAKVTAVCYEVGFQNLSYFSLTFRRHVGVSPTVYRTRLGEQVSVPSTAVNRNLRSSDLAR